MTLGLLGAAIGNAATLAGAPGPGTITKDFSGQWFLDVFDRGDSDTIGNGWTEIGTAMEISSSRLVASDGSLGQVFQDFTILPNAIVQINWRIGDGSVSLGEIAIRTDVGGDNDERQKILISEINNFVQMIVRTGGVNQETFNAAQTFNPGDEVTARLCIIDDGTYQIKGYVGLSGSIDSLTGTLTEFIDETPSFEPDQTEQRAYIATRGESVDWAADFFLGCGRSIYIDGLSTGFKARLISAGGEIVSGSGDGGSGSLVTEVDGKIQFEVSGTALPLNMIEVTDASDVIIGTFNSGSGIWGGDSYSFTP